MNKQYFLKFFLIFLAIFLLFPNFTFGENFEEITPEKIEKYLQLPEKNAVKLLDSLIQAFTTEWMYLQTEREWTSRPATEEEKLVPLVLRKAVRIHVLNHLLIDAPIEITWKIVKNGVDIARLLLTKDPKVLLEELERESIKKATEYGMSVLLQNEIRATPGVIKFRYLSNKGWQEVDIQHIMIYRPLSSKKGQVSIRFYSPNYVEPPTSQGSYGGMTGTPHSVQGKLPPFIAEITGKAEKGDFDLYYWIDEQGNRFQGDLPNRKLVQPSIKISFPGSVPDLGIRPLSFWERRIWKPIVAQFKEVEVIITKVTGKAPKIVETILNLPQAVENTWNGIKSMISKFNPFGAGVGQQVVAPVEIRLQQPTEPAPQEIREPVQEKKESTVVGESAEVKPVPISEKEKEEIKKKELQKRVADLLEQIDLVQAKIDRLTKEKEAQKIAEKTEKKPEQLKKEKKKEEEKKLDEDLAKKKKEETKKDTVCGFRSININTAIKEELQKITEVGPVLAQRIISARPFYSLNDLVKVAGIGAITLQKIITQGCAYVDLIYIGGGGSATSSSPSVTYPKILISEIQISPIENRFIELYNPNDSQISLNNWYIQRKTATGTTWGSLITSTQFEGKIIQPKNYFLISRTLGNSDILLTDLTLTENNSLVLKNPNREIVDKLGWGTAQEYETAPTSNPSTGQSIGRKWSTEDQNYLDTDNNSADFEIQTPTPKAQNQSPAPQPTTPSLTVVINEIAWMGTKASHTDEWIELYNTTKNPIDLTGWKIVSLTDNSSNITLTGTIPPLGFYLLERTNDDPVKNIPADWKGSFGRGGLKNDGEELELRDSQNNLVDKINCQKDEAGKCKSWFAGKNEKDKNNKWIKISMERIDPRVSGEDPSNWADNNPQIARNGLDAKGQPINGTPRAQNSVYKSLLPNPVENFAIDYQKSSGNKVVLTWSPATDDDTPSEKLSYEIRYLRNEEIGESNWQKAIQSPKTPEIDSESGKFTITISDLDYNSTYYFGIRAFDGQNYSSLSTTTPYQIPSALINSPWPMFGGNSQRNHQSSYSGPNATPTLIWIYNQDSNPQRPNWNPLYTSPVIRAEGTIFSSVIYPVSGRGILALNPNGNKKLFQKENIKVSLALQPDGSVLPDDRKTKDNNENVYLVQTKTLLVLDSQGKEKWKKEFQFFCSTITEGIEESENKISIFAKNSSCPSTEPTTDFFLSKTVLSPEGNIYLTAAARVYFPTSGNRDYLYLFIFSPDGRLIASSTIFQSYTQAHQSVSSAGNAYFFYLTYGFWSPNLWLTSISSSGKILWTKQILSNYTSISPILIDNRENLYFVVGKDVFGWDKDGNEIWKIYLAENVPSNWYLGGIGIALGEDGTLYLSGRGAILALK